MAATRRPSGLARPEPVASAGQSILFCSCEKPLPNPDDLTCVLCGRASVAALEPKPETIRVDPLDRLLTYRRRIHYQASLN